MRCGSSAIAPRNSKRGKATRHIVEEVMHAPPVATVAWRTRTPRRTGTGLRERDGSACSWDSLGQRQIWARRMPHVIGVTSGWFSRSPGRFEFASREGHLYASDTYDVACGPQM